MTGNFASRAYGVLDAMPDHDPMTALDEILATLKTRRVELGLSQAEVADRMRSLGVPGDDANFARLENGGRRLTVEKFYVWCRALGAVPMVAVDVRREPLTPEHEQIVHDATQILARLPAERARRMLRMLALASED